MQNIKAGQFPQRWNAAIQTAIDSNMLTNREICDPCAFTPESLSLWARNWPPYTAQLLLVMEPGARWHAVLCMILAAWTRLGGSPCYYLVFRGNPLYSLVIPDIPFYSRAYPGTTWHSLVVPDISCWIFPDFPEIPWYLLIILGFRWNSLIFPCSPWYFFVTSGVPWYSLPLFLFHHITCLFLVFPGLSWY